MWTRSPRSSARRRRTSLRTDLLIVGLGNPGRRYEGTRHNIGFAVVETLARRHGFAKLKRGYDGHWSDGSIGGRRALLLEPGTFMNLSGRSVAAAVRATRLPMERVLVVHDHIDLPFGRLRLVNGGGSGGHNGLKSITGLLGPEYARLRIGVGRPASTDPDVVAAYVLGRFSEGKVAVADLVEAAADAVESWVDGGLEATAPRKGGGGG